MSAPSPSSSYDFGFTCPLSLMKANRFDVGVYRTKLRELAVQLERQEWKLCRLCEGITIQKMKRKNSEDQHGRKGQGYAHHASWADLKNSGNSGCRLCFILYNISILAVGSETGITSNFGPTEDSYIRLYLNPTYPGVIRFTSGESLWFCRLALCISQGNATIALGRCCI